MLCHRDGRHVCCQGSIERKEGADLYAHGAWLTEKQPLVEAALWEIARRRRNPGADSGADRSDLFLYDVTSSYFEGTKKPTLRTMDAPGAHLPSNTADLLHPPFWRPGA